MCRLIVRAAVESTCVGVLVPNNGRLDMSQCVLGLSQCSTRITFCVGPATLSDNDKVMKRSNKLALELLSSSRNTCLLLND